MEHRYLHKFGTDQQFQTAYGANTYEEPWVSLTTATGEVHYNRSPYFGKGLVFDMSQSGDGNWFWDGGATTYKLIYDDSIPFAEVNPNPFNEGFIYQFDQDVLEEYRYELDSQGLSITIINAKSIDQTLDNTIDLTLTLDGNYIGGDDRVAYRATLSNGRKIWLVVHSYIGVGENNYYPGFFLFMKEGY